MTQIIATKRVCSIGTGIGTYFERSWGIKPGDLVQMTIEVIRKDGEKDE